MDTGSAQAHEGALLQRGHKLTWIVFLVVVVVGSRDLLQLGHNLPLDQGSVELHERVDQSLKKVD